MLKKSIELRTPLRLDEDGLYATMSRKTENVHTRRHAHCTTCHCARTAEVASATLNVAQSLPQPWRTVTTPSHPIWAKNWSPHCSLEHSTHIYTFILPTASYVLGSVPKSRSEKKNNRLIPSPPEEIDHPQYHGKFQPTLVASNLRNNHERSWDKKAQ